VFNYAGFPLLLYWLHDKGVNMPEPPIATKPMIEQIFNDAAESYDRVGPSIFTQFGERLVEHMHLAPGMRVLDIATGKGAVLIPAAHRVGPEGQVIGIDLSDAILKEAEHAICVEGLTNVKLHKMDAEHLEFPDQSFDAVTCAFALFFFPDMEAALREMYRVCKPGGCLAITYFNKTPPPFSPGFPILIQQLMANRVRVQMPQPLAYTPQEVEALLGRLGFRLIETYNEINDIIYTSGEDWWSFLLTLASRASIMGMNEEMRARFKEEYLAKLRPMSSQDGLHISLAVIYALAKR
jgi:ubiquinone/menaquinone biosynthesis C-methylase UbiE